MQTSADREAGASSEVALEVRWLHVYFQSVDGEIEAVRDLSFTVASGEIVGMPANAMQRVRGRDISMIFQEPMTALDPVFRVGDQIAETIRIHQRVSDKVAKARAIELLDDVGIPDPR